MTAAIHWCAMLLTVAAMADAVAHGAYVALAVLVLVLQAVLRLMFPKAA